MRDHWFPRNCRKQFVKSHAPTASGRDDDGAKHEQKSETSNAQRPTPNVQFRKSQFDLER
jgi:hypothetical protein